MRYVEASLVTDRQTHRTTTVTLEHVPRVICYVVAKQNTCYIALTTNASGKYYSIVIQMCNKINTGLVFYIRVWEGACYTFAVEGGGVVTQVQTWGLRGTSALRE